MPQTYRIPDEVQAIYEAARPVDGPYSPPNPPAVQSRLPYHLVLQGGKTVLDLDGQILCDSLGDLKIRERVREVMAQTNDMEVFGPAYTHPEFDLAQKRIADELDRTYGGGPWTVAFRSSGTRANEEAIGFGRAAGATALVVNREAYHGAGLMRAAIGHSSWRSDATIPFGMPVTHLESEDIYDGRDYSGDFGRFIDCQLGADGIPYYLTEGGVGGVMGFELISPSGIRHTSMGVHERGGVVHFDDVQVAPYRTGDNFFSVDGLVDQEYKRTIPDLVTSAKGLGVGYPFAFVAARKELLERAKGHLGKDYDTYGRNLRGATAFNALYEKMKAPGFYETLQEGITKWREGLTTIAGAQREKVLKVTGKGFMSGLALDTAGRVGNFRKIGVEETGIICCVGGIRGSVLRLGIKLDSPPEIIDEALQKIEDTLKKVA